MKILKIIGLLILAIIAFVLIAGLMVSKDFNYEKSITINAPIDSVWTHVGTFASQNAWEPWNEYDPTMKKTYGGTDGTVGATYAWESPQKEVGKGSQTITKVEAPTTFETDLKFLEPFESNSDAYFHLTSEGSGTKVVWGFKSQMPYPFNVMKLFMDMEKEMDKDFGKGLSNLKAISEKQ